MPQIKAKLGNTTATGVNANDRPQNDSTAPSISIRANAALLADVMDALNNDGRSAYACAEAQALAKLLNAVNAPIDFRSIEFNCPSAAGGKELWNLCKNCNSWLSKKGGWGANKTFRLADSILDKLQPAPKTTFQYNAAEFPVVGH